MNCRIPIANYRLPTFCRHGWIGFSLLVLCALSEISLVAAPATFTASLDRDTISVGESATLSFTIEDGVPAEVPIVPPVPNLSIRSLGQSSKYNFINGRSSSTLAYNFLVRATQPGDYTLPAVNALVDGKTLTSQPLKLKVLKSGAATPEAEKTAFLKMICSKTQAYLGEVLPLEIRLYAQVGRLKQPAPQLNQEGFTVGKMIQQPETKTLIGNQYYSMLVYKTYVIAAKTGDLTLGPATLLLAIPHPNTRISAFGGVLDWMDTTLNSEPLTIHILPLPANDVPADFTGAVGNYSLFATASTNVVTVDEPITLTIQIAGRGPVESLNLNSLEHWRDFKTYPPITKLETSDPLGLQGIKTFEQVVIPENAEIKQVPPITFSFFDPDQQSYRTMTQPAIPITVRPGSAAPAQPTVVANTGQNQEEPKAASDIVHIKTRPGTLAAIDPPLIQRTWFLALQSVPVLAWLAVVIRRKREEQLANNPRLRRRRQVAQIIRTGLTDLRQMAVDHRVEDFFAAVFRLLQEQLGERLDLPASAITEAVVEERMRPGGTPEATLRALEELFLTCNQARYAPQQTSEELATLVPKVEQTLRELQRVALKF
jgi:hypothetical protein